MKVGVLRDSLEQEITETPMAKADGSFRYGIKYSRFDK